MCSQAIFSQALSLISPGNHKIGAQQALLHSPARDTICEKAPQNKMEEQTILGYAVLLYFDDKTEQSLLDLGQALTDWGVASSPELKNNRPHVSLAGFSKDIDCDRLISLVQEYANHIQPFEVVLSSIGIFPSAENVLFVSPMPTLQLLTHHKELHLKLAEGEFVSSHHYLPNHWMPHCTVKIKIPNHQVPTAVEYCHKNFKPIHGQFQEMGVIEYFPIKPLMQWNLPVKR